VWELEGPMPILNRSNTLNDMVVLRFLVIGIGANLVEIL
jgi:hypothetical protein